MKIVRPEQPIIRKSTPEERQELAEEQATLVLNNIEVPVVPVEDFELEVNFPETIEDVMQSVLKENTKNVTFEVTLTKRQYELYLQKGGESWLKKALIGQVKKKKKSK